MPIGFLSTSTRLVALFIPRPTRSARGSNLPRHGHPSSFVGSRRGETGLSAQPDWTLDTAPNTLA
jgi:hypothetical protein